MPLPPGSNAPSDPSYDFRASIDSSRFTRAIYYAPSANAAFNVWNEYLDTPANVQFRVEGFILPIRTKTAVTITGYDVIYLY